jgi:hypothetical protein
MDCVGKIFPVEIHSGFWTPALVIMLQLLHLLATQTQGLYLDSRTMDNMWTSL